MLFFTLLAEPTRRPCHTQPHRLLTGSEHRAACGRNSSKQWCVFVCFFALRRLNISVRTAGLYSARRRVLSRIISMLFATIPHFRIFDTKVTLSFMDYFIKSASQRIFFHDLRAKKRTDKTMTNFVGSWPTVTESVFHTHPEKARKTANRAKVLLHRNLENWKFCGILNGYNCAHLSKRRRAIENNRSTELLFVLRAL